VGWAHRGPDDIHHPETRPRPARHPWRAGRLNPRRRALPHRVAQHRRWQRLPSVPLALERCDRDLKHEKALHQDVSLPSRGRRRAPAFGFLQATLDPHAELLRRVGERQELQMAKKYFAGFSYNCEWHASHDVFLFVSRILERRATSLEVLAVGWISGVAPPSPSEVAPRRHAAGYISSPVRRRRRTIRQQRAQRVLGGPGRWRERRKQPTAANCPGPAGVHATVDRGVPYRATPSNGCAHLRAASPMH
jgi:hypothetical protein